MMWWKKWASCALLSYSNVGLKAGDGSGNIPEALKARIGSAHHKEVSDEKPSERKPQVLRVAIDGSSYRNLNPNDIKTTVQGSILSHLFEGLLRRDSNGKFEGACAESWSYDPKTFIWTFKIRPDLQWSNGRALNAYNFFWAIQAQFDVSAYPGRVIPEGTHYRLLRQWNLKYGKDILEGRASLKNLGMWTPNALTLKFQWAEPCNPELCYETFEAPQCFPIPFEHFKHAKAIRDSRDYEKLVSNGPFKLAPLAPGSVLTLKKNPYYWGSREVHLEEVRYSYFYTPLESVKAWKEGKVDISLSLDAKALKSLNSEDYDFLSHYEGSQTIQLEFNSKCPKLQDRRVRQALNLVLDRKSLSESLSFPPKDILYTYREASPVQSEWKDWSMEQRVAKAKQLMKEAGYHQGNKLQLTLAYTKTLDKSFVIALYKALMQLQDELDLKMDKPYEAIHFAEKRMNGSFEFCVANFGGFSFIPFHLYEMAYGGNADGFKKPEYNHVIEAFKMANNWGVKERLLLEIEAFFLEEVPKIPLFKCYPYYLVNPSVGGWNTSHNVPVSPTGQVLCRFLFKKDNKPKS